MTPAHLARLLHKIRTEPAKVDEVREFMPAVVEVARQLGYNAFHTTDPRRDRGVVLDLRLVRGPRYLWVELKAERGKLSLAQRQEIERLERAGIEWHVFRPSEWDARVLPCLMARDRWAP